MREAPLGSSFWVDGQRSTSNPLPDRGQEFGDGLFETILVVKGRPMLLHLHQDRFAAGFAALGFAGHVPELSDLIAPALAADSRLPRQILRVTYSRAAGERGYAPGNSVDHHCVIRLTELSPTRLSPATLGVSTLQLSHQPLLAGIKHLNRLEQVLAASQRTALGVDEVVTCDQQGRPVAVSSGNLFIRQGAALLTPQLGQCGIAGTRRRHILEVMATETGYVAREEDFSLDALRESDEVFFCNTVVGVRPVATFEDRRWQETPAATALSELFDEVLGL